MSRLAKFIGLTSLLVTVSACSSGFPGFGGGSLSSANIFGGFGGGGSQAEAEAPTQQATRVSGGAVVAVNRDLWNASLDVLDFLPLQTVDPFTGVIVTGFGTPPGGSRAYRATVFIQDPELDARALRVVLFTRNGQASAETVRAVEDAILTRARQLRQGQ